MQQRHTPWTVTRYIPYCFGTVRSGLKLGVSALQILFYITLQMADSFLGGVEREPRFTALAVSSCCSRLLTDPATCSSAGLVALGIASHFPLTAFNIVASLVLVLIPVICSFHNLYCDIVQSREIVLLLLFFCCCFFFLPGTAL